ncbi:MAG: hypothetical protein ACRD2Z_11220 [Thermoanaerobaculia bacterium]
MRPVESGGVAFPGVERLLPHRAPALLVREIVRWDGEAVLCRGAVPEEHPLAEGGSAPVWLAIEMGAQAGAVLEALSRGGDREDGEPRLGYLVGLRGCTFHVPGLPVGGVLEVGARRIGGAGPLALFAVEVTGEDGGVLASGQVSAYAAGS